MSNITITKKSKRDVFASENLRSSKRIVAADEDMEEFDFDDTDDADGLMDAVDDVADQVDNLQDTVEEEAEDSVTIEVNNNITDHYIAECEKCHGVFISAVIKSDQKIDHVSGVCPLCNKDSDQYLKWVIEENK